MILNSKLLLAALALMLSLAACNGPQPTATTAPIPAPSATSRPNPPASPTAVLTAPTTAPTPGATATARPSPTALPTAAPITPTAIPPTTSAPTRRSALPDDPRAAIRQAMLAQSKTLPFSSLTEIKTGATTIRFLGEVESPQRVRVTTASETAVLYDGKLYIKEGQAVWREDSRAAASINGFLSGMLDAAAVEAMMGMIKTVKQVGGETLDEIRCRIYEYAYAGEQFGVPTSGKARLWVAEDDGLPIKQVMESETSGHVTTATQSFDYGADIQVQAPITR